MPSSELSPVPHSCVYYPELCPANESMRACACACTHTHKTHIHTHMCLHSLYSENKLGLTAQYIDRIHLEEYNLPVFPNTRFGVWLADKVQMEIFLDSDQEEEKGWERFAPWPAVALLLGD